MCRITAEEAQNGLIFTLVPNTHPTNSLSHSPSTSFTDAHFNLDEGIRVRVPLLALSNIRINTASDLLRRGYFRRNYYPNTNSDADFYSAQEENSISSFSLNLPKKQSEKQKKILLSPINLSHAKDVSLQLWLHQMKHLHTQKVPLKIFSENSIRNNFLNAHTSTSEAPFNKNNRYPASKNSDNDDDEYDFSFLFQRYESEFAPLDGTSSDDSTSHTQFSLNSLQSSPSHDARTLLLPPTFQEAVISRYLLSFSAPSASLASSFMNTSFTSSYPHTLSTDSVFSRTLPTHIDTPSELINSGTQKVRSRKNGAEKQNKDFTDSIKPLLSYPKYEPFQAYLVKTGGGFVLLFSKVRFQIYFTFYILLFIF